MRNQLLYINSVLLNHVLLLLLILGMWFKPCSANCFITLWWVGIVVSAKCSFCGNHVVLIV